VVGPASDRKMNSDIMLHAQENLESEKAPQRHLREAHRSATQEDRGRAGAGHVPDRGDGQDFGLVDKVIDKRLLENVTAISAKV
jgi:hypothetical protein